MQIKNFFEKGKIEKKTVFPYIIKLISLFKRRSMSKKNKNFSTSCVSRSDRFKNGNQGERPYLNSHLVPLSIEHNFLPFFLYEMYTL